jgi:hypothetical protein
MTNKTFGIVLIIACLIIGLLVGIISFPYLFGTQAAVGEVLNIEKEESEEEVICQEGLEETRQEILVSDPPGPYPLTRGIVSWQEVYILALDWPEYQEALFLQGSVSSLEELAELAEGGKNNTVHVLKKGTEIVNSYYKGSKIIFVREILTKDRLVLHNGDGKSVILVSCGNPIRVLPQEKVVVIPPPIVVVTPPPWSPPPGPPPPTHCDSEGQPGSDPGGGEESCPSDGGPGSDPN